MKVTAWAPVAALLWTGLAAAQLVGPITIGQPIDRAHLANTTCTEHSYSQGDADVPFAQWLHPADCSFPSLATTDDVWFELGGVPANWIVNVNIWDASAKGGDCARAGTNGQLAQVDYWVRPPDGCFPGKYIGYTQYQHLVLTPSDIRRVDLVADGNGFVRTVVGKPWSKANWDGNMITVTLADGTVKDCWQGVHVHTISSRDPPIENIDGTYTSGVRGPLQGSFTATNNVLWEYDLRPCATGYFCKPTAGAHGEIWARDAACNESFYSACGSGCARDCQHCNIGGPEVGTGSGSYGNCGLFGARTCRPAGCPPCFAFATSAASSRRGATGKRWGARRSTSRPTTFSTTRSRFWR
jgi:hypothetical protein